MITKYKTNLRNLRRNHDPSLDYISNNVEISNYQRKRLTDLYCQNFQCEELENRLAELDGLSSLEAQEIILQFETASWS